QHFLQSAHNFVLGPKDSAHHAPAPLAEAATQHPSQPHARAPTADVGGDASPSGDAGVDLGPSPTSRSVLSHQYTHVEWGAGKGGKAQVGLHDITPLPLHSLSVLVQRVKSAGRVSPPAPTPLVPPCVQPNSSDAFALATFSGFDEN